MLNTLPKSAQRILFAEDNRSDTDGQDVPVKAVGCLPILRFYEKVELLLHEATRNELIRT